LNSDTAVFRGRLEATRTNGLACVRWYTNVFYLGWGHRGFGQWHPPFTLQQQTKRKYFIALGVCTILLGKQVRINPIFSTLGQDA
jgi:hypothetical protein